MTIHTPISKIKRIEDFNRNYETSKNIIQLTKSGMVELKKNERESKLRLKFSKLEIRLHKGVRNMQEFTEIKGSWVALLATFGFAVKLNEVFQIKRTKKRNIQRLVRKFKNFAFALAKWLGVLIEIRRGKFMRGLYNKALTKILLWGKYRIQSKIIIVNAIERNVNKNMIVPLAQNLRLQVAVK